MKVKFGGEEIVKEGSKKTKHKNMKPRGSILKNSMDVFHVEIKDIDGPIVHHHIKEE